jgi:hypothetical protein
MSYEEWVLRSVGRIAYELASTGEHVDFAGIRRAIIDEGHAALSPWLDKPGVSDAIDEICAVGRNVLAIA